MFYYCHNFSRNKKSKCVFYDKILFRLLKFKGVLKYENA